MALALKAEHFRNGSFATKLAGPACHSMFALHRKATWLLRACEMTRWA